MEGGVRDSKGVGQGRPGIVFKVWSIGLEKDQQPHLTALEGTGLLVAVA